MTSSGHHVYVDGTCIWHFLYYPIRDRIVYIVIYMYGIMFGYAWVNQISNRDRLPQPPGLPRPVNFVDTICIDSLQRSGPPSHWAAAEMRHGIGRGQECGYLQVVLHLPVPHSLLVFLCDVYFLSPDD